MPGALRTELVGNGRFPGEIKVGNPGVIRRHPDPERFLGQCLSRVAREMVYTRV